MISFKHTLVITVVLMMGMLVSACTENTDDTHNTKPVEIIDGSGNYTVYPDYIIDSEGFIMSSTDSSDTIILDENIKGIGASALQNNKHIKSLTANQPITCRVYAMEYSAIENLAITSKDSIIEDNSFANCKHLKDITINGNLGFNAFKGCSALNSITILEGCTTIHADTFSDCGTINVITLPSSIVNLTVNSFKNTKVLKIRGYNETIAQSIAEELGAEFISLGDLQ